MKRLVLSRLRLLAFLDNMEKVGGAARSLYLPPGQPLPEVEDLLRNVLSGDEANSDIAKLAADSKTGAVVFWGLSRRCLIMPPFPIKEKYLTLDCDVKPLRSLLQPDFLIGLILVRLGAFAIGICRGEELIASKVGTGLIHGRHKKGGSSQHRFERHRDKQIEQFVVRVSHHVQEQLEPHARVLDYVVYGGSRTAMLELRKRCQFLRQFDEHTLPPLFDVPDPRQRVLEAAVGKTWSSTLVLWDEDGS